MDNHTLLNSPWAITPEAYQRIADFDLSKLPDPVLGYIEENRADSGAVAKTYVESKRDFLRQFEEQIFVADDGVATLNISGPIMPNPDVIDRYYFDAVDSVRVTNLIQAATNSDQIESLVININSPGGSVVGTPEMGKALRAFNESGKESVATGNVLIASAAYWFASQATRIEVTDSCMIGSIGVLRPHVDASEYRNKIGINVKVFRSGIYKAAGAYNTSMTDAQSDEIQDSIDAIHEDFKATVNHNRTIAAEHMEGQIFYGKDAVKIGIADSITDSIQSVISRLGGDGGSGSVSDPVDTKNKTTMSKDSDTKKQGAQSDTDTPDLESVSADLDSANARIDELTQENSTLSEANDGLNDQVETLTSERDTASERVTALETELAESDSKLEDLQKDFDEKVETAANEKAKELAEVLAEQKAAEIAAKNGGVDPLDVKGTADGDDSVIEDSQIALLSGADLWKKHAEIKNEKGADAATAFYRKFIR